MVLGSLTLFVPGATPRWRANTPLSHLLVHGPHFPRTDRAQVYRGPMSSWGESGTSR